MSQHSSPSRLTLPFRRPQPEHLHFPGLESLRAGAILLVVALHSAVPYLVHPMQGLAWPTHDARPSPTVDAMFWSVEGFIMPLFFLLSGFLAALSLERHGCRQFLDQKRRRLLKPLVIGGAIILPLEFYIWTTGWVIDDLITLRKMRSLKLPPELSQDLWGLSHLWYLEYLFLLCLGLVMWHRPETRQTRPPVRTVRLISFPFLIAIPIAAILYFQPEVMTGFQHGFLPFPLKFLHSAVFFAAGVWLWGRREQLPTLHAWSPCLLGLAALLIGPTLEFVRRHAAPDQLTAQQQIWGAASLGLFAATMSIGWFGWFASQRRSASPAVQRVARASFWIYLIHHPLAGLLHVDLMSADWPGLGKFALTFTANLTICLISYELLQWWLLQRQPRVRADVGPVEAGGELTVARRAA